MKNNHNQELTPQSQWALIWKQFKRRKTAIVSLFLIIFFYIAGVLVPEFIAPNGKLQKFNNTYLPPQKIHFIDNDGNFHIRPFVYNWEKKMDPDTWEITYKQNTDKRHPIYFFVEGKEYKLMGLYKFNIHLFNVNENGKLFLFGTDNLGRDVFSRTVFACRISLTIGFVGVLISLILGLLIGGISGLIGGKIDEIIQRSIETLVSIPKIPLWLGVAAAVPRDWSAIQVYFAITIILSLVGWTGLARVVRSKFMSLREEDFVAAAIGYNTPSFIIIFRHLIPNFLSYIIVNLTLTIPWMIIAETSLSFLGVGLRPPVVSLGVLLKSAQSFQTVSMYPWLMLPGLIVIIVVLCYNFVGDGLRDAADPYN